ncbi:MAG TPA: TIM-barrel domain-containing protein, partial [Hyphomicrobiales bacterium]|nr:TIM-barrel domain-containing protein [Hyphomicrobiales bacterium]
MSHGYNLTLMFLDKGLARVLVTPPGGLRMPRTWSLSPELTGEDPIDGRDRLDLTGFEGAPIVAVTENEINILIETEFIKAEIRRSPLAITWYSRSSVSKRFEPVLQDRETQAYVFSRRDASFTHYLARDPKEHYYGFGEASGDANKHGRRLRMRSTDAYGYDAATSDPLYKHIPFYVTVRPDLGGRSLGLFYDNLAHGAFDLGKEIGGYHGPYRSFEAVDGDLDLYLLFGPVLSDVVAQFTALTGRMAFPPRWSLSYSGAAMEYTEEVEAVGALCEFVGRLQAYDIPCRSFHLSSGYTKKSDKRYNFVWDRERFPNPPALAAKLAAAGIKLIANVKPAMMPDHPLFGEVASFQGFIGDSEDETQPYIAQFWGGGAAYLDFTNPATSAWWARHVRAQLLDYGIAATWNDNNEYEIWDDGARANVKGHGGTMACLRPVQCGLMLRASGIAQQEHAPTKRPFLVTRSGGPGLQRYAQTWTGDNRTEWKTLRYNLRMGHGLSLSGISNFGHDAGGFAGPRPDPELFVRWVEQAIYWPRFTIHSWNDFGGPSEPWMYPAMLPLIRESIRWRERLVPLLYTLMWRSHICHEPIIRPLFYDFPEQLESYRENDQFMLGRDLLLAPAVEPAALTRSVWLPNVAGGWYDIRNGEPVESGWHETVPAPLGSAPAFIRAGAILPLGPCPSW